MMQNNAFLTD